MCTARVSKMNYVSHHVSIAWWQVLIDNFGTFFFRNTFGTNGKTSTFCLNPLLANISIYLNTLKYSAESTTEC